MISTKNKHSVTTVIECLFYYSAGIIGSLMKLLKFNKYSSLIISLLVLGNIASSFEFDPKMLSDLGSGEVDLSAFSGIEEQVSGDYVVDVKINGQVLLWNQDVEFYSNNDESEVCFTRQIIEKLPLKEKVITTLLSRSQDSTELASCFDFMGLDESLITEFDSSNQILNLTIPQVFLNPIDSQWVPPREREIGISGAFVDFSHLFIYQRNKHYGPDTSFRSHGVIGANIGVLRLRSSYQYSSGDNGGDKFSWNQRYAFMDLPSLNAKIYAGELYTRSTLFNSVRIKGVSMHSDENMMPAYLKGYAPQITGAANSNAIVTIAQHGAVISSTQVSAGPFAISDLPSHISGTVDVSIEESNGEIRKYQVDIAQVPFLTRQGDVRYSINMGRLDPFSQRAYQSTGRKINDDVFSGDISYGLSSYLSVFGGTLFTTNGNYLAVNAGIGVNLGFLGALSADITQSKSKSPFDEEKKGQSYRFNYAKKLGKYTNISLVGYRFSSRDYRSIDNYISINSSGSRGRLELEKNRLTASISQVLPAIDSNFYFSVTKGSYWNQKSISNYNVGISKTLRSGLFKSSNILFTVNKNTYSNNNKEVLYSLYLTIPLGTDYSKRLQFRTAYSDQSNKLIQNVTYYDNNVLDGNLSLGVNTSNKRDLSGGLDYSLNANYDRGISFGRVNVIANYSEQYTNASASLDGSITITQYGIATHEKVSEDSARLIVDVGAPGVTFGGGYNKGQHQSNIFGLSGINNVTSYVRNTYAVDNDHLPDNVEVPEGVINIALNDGAIGYRSLGAIAGEKALTVISLPDGSHPPFGATVYRENGENSEVGMIAGDGLTYLSGLNKHSKFIVKWNSVKSCSFKIDKLDPVSLENITCYMD